MVKYEGEGITVNASLIKGPFTVDIGVPPGV